MQQDYAAKDNELKGLREAAKEKFSLELQLQNTRNEITELKKYCESFNE